MSTIVLSAGSESALNDDIQEANAAGSGAYEIDLTASIDETADLTAINLQSGVTLAIKGGAADANVIDGGGAQDRKSVV